MEFPEKTAAHARYEEEVADANRELAVELKYDAEFTDITVHNPPAGDDGRDC